MESHYKHKGIMEIFQGTLHRRRGNSAYLLDRYENLPHSIVVANDNLPKHDYTDVLFRIDGTDNMPNFLQYERLLYSQDNVQIGRQLADNKLYAIRVAPDAYHVVRFEHTSLPHSLLDRDDEYVQLNLAGLVDWTVSTAYLLVEDRREC